MNKMPEIEITEEQVEKTEEWAKKLGGNARIAREYSKGVIWNIYGEPLVILSELDEQRGEFCTSWSLKYLLLCSDKHAAELAKIGVKPKEKVSGLEGLLKTLLKDRMWI